MNTPTLPFTPGVHVLHPRLGLLEVLGPHNGFTLDAERITDTGARTQVIVIVAPSDLTPLPKPKKPAKSTAKSTAKCDGARVKAVKRFHAIARDYGLDLSNKETIRLAVGKYFGLGPIGSRGELSTSMWMEAGTAIKAGHLCWA